MNALSRQQKEGLSYRKRRTDAGRAGRVHGTTLNRLLPGKLHPRPPLVLRGDSLNHLHPPPGGFTVVPRVLKMSLLVRPVERQKKINPSTQ